MYYMIITQYGYSLTFPKLPIPTNFLCSNTLLALLMV